MLCPNCEKEMIVVERDKIELDYCIFCHGFWFDNLEWNILAKKVFIDDNVDLGDMYSIPKIIVKEKNRKCPICNKTMEKFQYYDVLLDRCPDKHGVWFDEKEVSEVINHASDSNKGLVEFLGEVFDK